MSSANVRIEEEDEPTDNVEIKAEDKNQKKHDQSCCECAEDDRNDQKPWKFAAFTFGNEEIQNQVDTKKNQGKTGPAIGLDDPLPESAITP